MRKMAQKTKTTGDSKVRISVKIEPCHHFLPYPTYPITRKTRERKKSEISFTISQFMSQNSCKTIKILI